MSKPGRVIRVSQPPWERLLTIDIEGPEGEVSIIAELMPRRANVLLVQEGLILDCLNRVGPEDNRYRLSLPNHDYVQPPPIRDQLEPARVTESDFASLLDSAGKGFDADSATLAGKDSWHESIAGEGNGLPRDRRRAGQSARHGQRVRFLPHFRSLSLPCCSESGSRASAAAMA